MSKRRQKREARRARGQGHDPREAARERLSRSVFESNHTLGPIEAARERAAADRYRHGHVPIGDEPHYLWQLGLNSVLARPAREPVRGEGLIVRRREPDVHHG